MYLLLRCCDDDVDSGDDDNDDGDDDGKDVSWKTLLMDVLLLLIDIEDDDGRPITVGKTFLGFFSPANPTWKGRGKKKKKKKD